MLIRENVMNSPSTTSSGRTPLQSMVGVSLVVRELLDQESSYAEPEQHARTYTYDRKLAHLATDESWLIWRRQIDRKPLASAQRGPAWAGDH
jgi:hypothetical protein